jgi:hypothetical protein
MRYTIIINKHSISFKGILVIFLSVLFRQISFLILATSSIPLITESFEEKDSWFWSFLFFSFFAVQDATSLFFSHQKLYAKSITGYSFAFWTSIAGHKKYAICFPKIFCKKQIMFKCNLSKVMWPLGVLFKFILYGLELVYPSASFDKRAKDGLFYLVLIGGFSELLSHFFSFVYYENCHVWKDILPAKLRKRNLRIFSSELEIISEEEGHIGLLNKTKINPS